MAKKNLDAINTQKKETGTETGEVYSTIERGKNTYKQQGTASPEEQAERAAQLKTQGRKGCHAVRINTAFTPENHEFVMIMSKVRGQSMTQFINYCIEQYRQEHGDVYEAAKTVIAMTEDAQEGAQ